MTSTTDILAKDACDVIVADRLPIFPKPRTPRTKKLFLKGSTDQRARRDKNRKPRIKYRPFSKRNERLDISDYTELETFRAYAGGLSSRTTEEASLVFTTESRGFTRPKPPTFTGVLPVQEPIKEEKYIDLMNFCCGVRPRRVHYV